MTFLRVFSLTLLMIACNSNKSLSTTDFYHQASPDAGETAIISYERRSLSFVGGTLLWNFRNLSKILIAPENNSGKEIIKRFKFIYALVFYKEPESLPILLNMLQLDNLEDISLLALYQRNDPQVLNRIIHTEWFKRKFEERSYALRVLISKLIQHPDADPKVVAILMKLGVKLHEDRFLYFIFELNNHHDSIILATLSYKTPVYEAFVLHGLKSTNVHLRRKSFHLLGGILEPKHLKYIVKGLNDPDVRIRRISVSLFATFRHPRTLSILKAMMLNEKVDDDIRGTAIISLMFDAPQEVTPYIYKLNKNKNLRRDLACGIAASKVAVDEHLILGFLGDENKHVRKCALDFIKRLKLSGKNLNLLLKAIDTQYSLVRLLALEKIAQYRNIRAVKTIINHLTDEDRLIRDVARTHLYNQLETSAKSMARLYINFTAFKSSFALNKNGKIKKHFQRYLLKFQLTAFEAMSLLMKNIEYKKIPWYLDIHYSKHDLVIYEREPLIRILRQIHSNNYKGSLRALIALGMLEDKKSIPIIHAGLNSHDELDRLASIRALTYFKNPILFKPLINVAQYDRSKIVRRMAIGALANVGHTQIKSVFLKALKDGSPYVVKKVVTYSGIKKMSEAAPLILPFLKSKNRDLSRSAQHALREIKSKSTIPTLIKYLRDPDIFNKQPIIAVLQVFNDPRAKNALKEYFHPLETAKVVVNEISMWGRAEHLYIIFYEYFQHATIIFADRSYGFLPTQE